MKLGKVLRKYRISQETTLRDLAQEMRIPYPTLSRIENGAVDVEARTLMKVFNWLCSTEKGND